MLLQIGTLLAITATVCFHLVGCNKKEKSMAKHRASLDMGVSDLEDVQPIKREVSRAQEIKDGARGKKAEYRTLAQMQTSDFEKSINVEAPKSDSNKKPSSQRN